MKHLLIICWVTVVLSLLFMVIGHFGNHNLSWQSSQISTYAATAPYDYLITTSMLLSSVSIIFVGILVTKYKIFGSSYLVHFVPVLSGASAAGLMMVAKYEETAKNLTQLKESGFWAIRVQSFHDAGLLIFFNSAILFIVLLGILATIYSGKKLDKISGIVVVSAGPAAYFLMTTKWPKTIGFEGVTTGINERAALFCLWLAVVLVLAVVSNKVLRIAAKSSELR